MHIIVENEVEHDDGPPSWATFWSGNLTPDLVPDLLNHAASKAWSPQLAACRICITPDDKPDHELFTDAAELVADLQANW